MVRRALLDLHATRAATAAARTSFDDDEGRRSARGNDDPYLSGGRTLHRDEPCAFVDHHCISGDRDMVAKFIGVRTH